MKADFTRGFAPDRQRGERYRRVLLQKGRAILDSDVAAQVDATDTAIRDALAPQRFDRRRQKSRA